MLDVPSDVFPGKPEALEYISYSVIQLKVCGSIG